MMPPLNILCAYPFFTRSLADTLRPMGDNVRLLIDSGAFTAFHHGAPIDFDAYCAMLKAPPLPVWRYFNLDVIGDAAGSQRNFQLMRDRGLTPIPVFTRGATLDDLDAMFTHSDLVGIGGLVTRPRQPPYRYIKAIMQHAAGRPVHLLGFSHPDWIHYLRPFSCDSTSYVRVTRFGKIDLYLGQGRWENYDAPTATHRPPSEAGMAMIRALGLDPYQLQCDNAWKYRGIGMLLSAISWVRYAIDLERHQGTKLFFAVSQTTAVRMMRCYRLACEGGDINELLRDKEAA